MTSTTNKSIQEPASGSYNNAWAAPVNANWSLIDAALGGHVVLNVTSVSGTVTLTGPTFDGSGNLTSAGQYVNPIIEIGGTLTSNVTYQLPAGVGGYWYVANATSGAYTITFSSATGGGSTATIPQGATVPIISDGTNVSYGYNVATTAGGSNTQVQFNNSGVLAGSANLTWNGTALTSTAFVGPLTGNVTGNVSGSSGSCTGNAATATVATNATYAGATSYAAGYLQIPQNSQSSTYTATASDVGKHIYTANNVNINSGVFNPGDSFVVVNSGSGSLSIVQGSGVTLQLAGSATTGSRTVNAYGMATVLCVAANTFRVAGSGIV